jgi:tryptophan 2,3-dioxygenase
LSQPPHHDEMLFIVQHQTSELWLKLLIHELTAATDHLRNDRVWQFGKVVARCKRVLDQLTAQWSVLETLTPSEYMEFRDMLGPSSGFQSLQYRMVEFLLGNKNAAMLKVFAHDADGHAALQAGLGRAQPVRRVPALPGPLGPRHPLATPERDFHPAARHGSGPGAGVRAHLRGHRSLLARIRPVRGPGGPGNPVPAVALPAHAHGHAHHRLQAGHRRFQRGGFLRKALELTFFPELFEVRTVDRADGATTGRRTCRRLSLHGSVASPSGLNGARFDVGAHRSVILARSAPAADRDS